MARPGAERPHQASVMGTQVTTVARRRGTNVDSALRGGRVVGLSLPPGVCRVDRRRGDPHQTMGIGPCNGETQGCVERDRAAVHLHDQPMPARRRAPRDRDERQRRDHLARPDSRRSHAAELAAVPPCTNPWHSWSGCRPLGRSSPAHAHIISLSGGHRTAASAIGSAAGTAARQSPGKILSRSCHGSIDGPVTPQLKPDAPVRAPMGATAVTGNDRPSRRGTRAMPQSPLGAGPAGYRRSSK
jgi:hypothetical protein